MQKGVRRNHRSAALSPSLKLRWTTVALAEVVRAAQRPRCSPAASALRATACHAVAKRRREDLRYDPSTLRQTQGRPDPRRGTKGLRSILHRPKGYCEPLELVRLPVNPIPCE